MPLRICRRIKTTGEPRRPTLRRLPQWQGTTTQLGVRQSKSRLRRIVRSAKEKYLKCRAAVSLNLDPRKILQQVGLGLSRVQSATRPPTVRVRFDRILACDLARRGGQNGPDHFPGLSATAAHGLRREPARGTPGATRARARAAAGGASLERTKIRAASSCRTLEQRQRGDRQRLQGYVRALKVGSLEVGTRIQKPASACTN